MRKVDGGGREGGREKSVSPAPKHRIVPTPLLTNIFPAVLVCVRTGIVLFLNTREHCKKGIQASEHNYGGIR
jgi:hypothetical protein